MSNKSFRRLLALVEGALMIGLAIILSNFKFKIWGQGGSVSLVMVPLVVYAWRHGIAWGAGAGLAFGLLKFLMSGSSSLTWQGILLDYILAYGVVGLAGIFQRKNWGMVPGAVVGGVARFVVHFISGITIYRNTMPETFFNMSMTNEYVYSLIYNGSFVMLSMVLTIVVVTALQKPLASYDRWSTTRFAD